MINWSITPAVYNESFTFMELVGKLIYYADNHEVRIDELEKDIVDVKAKIEEHEEAITALQTWKTDVIEPFRTYTLSSLDILDERTDDLTTAVGLINNNIDEIEDNLTSEIATRANADTSLSQEIA